MVLSTALLIDLEFALHRYAIELTDVPRDHEGLSIQDRLLRLVEDGASYPGAEYRIADLRRDELPPWELFPENPDTVEDQERLMDEVHHLFKLEAQMRTGGTSLIPHAELPRPEHLDCLLNLLAFIDGCADPDVDPRIWGDFTLIDQVLFAVPQLRDAQRNSSRRAAIVQELAAGAVPSASEEIVRLVMDNEDYGLRNADITLAAHEVVVSQLRGRLSAVLDEIGPHVDVANQLRAANADMNIIERALHWPGSWRSVPVLAEKTEASRH